MRRRFLNPFGAGTDDDDEEISSGGNALYQTSLADKSDNNVDRNGDATATATAVKKQGTGGGTSPLTVAGYAVAGVGAIVLLNSAMTLARVGAGSSDKVSGQLIKVIMNHRIYK